MKKSSVSKKNNLTISIITIVLLVIGIGAILFFTSNKGENSQQVHQEDELDQKEITEEDDLKEEEPQPDEQKEDTDNANVEGSKEEKPEEEATDNEENENNGVQDPNIIETPNEDNGYIVGQTLPTEPTYINGALIANKKYPLPKDYNPGENAKARAAFEEMAAAARTAGFELTAFSTFRTFAYQSDLYNRYVKRDGKANADRYSASPGYSEHQTGLAFDIGEVNREELWLTSEFGETKLESG